jgi:hypothetical protein
MRVVGGLCFDGPVTAIDLDIGATDFEAQVMS